MAGTFLGAALQLVPAFAPPAVLASPGCGGGQAADFDGDGYNDLAVGIPFHDRGTLQSAGAVVIIRGSASGLTSVGSKLLTTQDAGVQPETNNFWGNVLVTGDFDGDEFADLAAGMPEDDIDLTANAGTVIVFYGSSSGLDESDAFVEGRAQLDGAAQESDRFGRALAAADLDGDGYCDLAVGVPGQDVGTADRAGAVHIIYGSPTGLTTVDDEVWHQDSPGMAGIAEAGDDFGRALAAANFGKSAHADLAVGVAQEVDGMPGAGAVHVLYGSASGVSTVGDRIWHRESPGVRGAAEAGAAFSAELTAANFGKSSHADLVVGIPGQDIGTAMDAGAVQVLYGSADGLTAAGDQVWHQDAPGMQGSAQTDDFFGDTLTAANLGRDGRADVAIGIPNQEVGGSSFAGAVHVLYGSSNGLTATGDQVWTQDAPEQLDRFGSALMAANLGGSSHAELAVGVPLQDGAGAGDGSDPDLGAVQVIPGSPSGLTSTGKELWFQSTAGQGSSQPSDRFGGGLGRIR